MIADITAIGSLIGLVISLLLLTWQTRAVAQQARVSNDIAGAAVVHDSMEGLHGVLGLLVDHPELRPYLYERQPCPGRGPNRQRVLMIVEMLADSLEGGLVTTRRTPASESFEDWTAYCRYMLDHSPALKEMAGNHRDWWPHLAALV